MRVADGFALQLRPRPLRNTDQHATTSASRTMDAKPRLALAKPFQSAKAACCKRELGSSLEVFARLTLLRKWPDNRVELKGKKF